MMVVTIDSIKPDTIGSMPASEPSKPGLRSSSPANVTRVPRPAMAGLNAVSPEQEMNSAEEDRLNTPGASAGVGIPTIAIDPGQFSNLKHGANCGAEVC